MADTEKKGWMLSLMRDRPPHHQQKPTLITIFDNEQDAELAALSISEFFCEDDLCIVVTNQSTGENAVLRCASF